MRPIVFAFSLALLASAACAGGNEPFGMWVAELKTQAQAKGVSKATLDRAFANMKPDPEVIELDQKQPEGTKSFAKYMKDTLPESRIAKGQELYEQNKALLKKIGEQYKVQPRFIVALWGIETSYGGFSGKKSTIRSLATLAYDGRRSDFFRDELLKALKIVDEGHVTLEAMKGSWAGAMGQCQFMPTSFLEYAVDGDGDGHKDIWNDKADVFASIASYLSKSGWSYDQTWGRKVKIPTGFAMELADGKTKFPLAEWAKMGVRNSDGSALPDKDIRAAITFPGKPNEGAYMVYDNYDVILKWNRSRYFATAVGTLSDEIGDE